MRGQLFCHGQTSTGGRRSEADVDTPLPPLSVVTRAVSRVRQELARRGPDGHLAPSGPGRRGCPRLTLHEDMTQPESPQKECGGVCPNQPCLGVPGRSFRLNRGEYHRDDT